VIVKIVRRQLLSLRILCDDIVALLYRYEERSAGEANAGQLREHLFAGRLALAAALSTLRRRGEVAVVGDAYRLTHSGRDRARELIRSHRLWEQYLVVETNAETDRIHDKAERFEHFTGRHLRDQLDRVTEAPDLDPHGKPIPLEKDDSQ
jgi:manganese/zinc/iron transport system permease protein